MYYTHLYGEIRKLIILLYKVFDNTLSNAGLMLSQRRRRWANINPTLDQCFVFAGSGMIDVIVTITTSLTSPANTKHLHNIYGPTELYKCHTDVLCLLGIYLTVIFFLQANCVRIRKIYTR